jgi:AraC-like DNA-binding protein
MVFNPDELHDGGPADAEGFVYRMLYLPPALVASIVADAAGGRPGPLPFARESVIRDPALAQLIVAAHAAHVSPMSARLEREALLDGLVLGFGARHGGAARPVVRGAGRGLERARDLLDADLAADLSGDALAEAAGLSRFHLNRAFRAAYGLPPHAWRLQRRLAEAKRLLAAGEGAAQVAAAVGFVDQSHLIRRFKGTFGITPAQFARAAAA